MRARKTATVVPVLAAFAVLAPAAAFAQVVAESPQDTIREVQLQLAARGFSPGPADGQLSDQTRDALRQLQRSRALTPSGTIDASTLSALGVVRFGQATASSTTAPAAGAPSTAPSGRPEGPNPANTILPGATAQGVPLGGATPAGAPSPSFGATPAGAPSPAFGATPPGMQSPSATVAGAPARR